MGRKLRKPFHVMYPHQRKGRKAWKNKESTTKEGMCAISLGKGDIGRREYDEEGIRKEKTTRNTLSFRGK